MWQLLDGDPLLSCPVEMTMAAACRLQRTLDTVAIHAYVVLSLVQTDFVPSITDLAHPFLQIRKLGDTALRRLEPGTLNPAPFHNNAFLPSSPICLSTG